MNRLDKLRGAGNEASEKAKQKITKLNTIQFQELINDLKKECVDASTISELQLTINDATKRNKLLADLINKGEAVGKCIVKILDKVI